VAFLDAQTGDDFDREDLYNQTNTAKYESLTMLRMQEVFARDYKSYAEELDGRMLDIGIASSFKDMEWLVKHAKGRQRLADEVVKFAQDGKKVLEVFSLLTKSADGREVSIFGFGEAGRKAITVFEENSKEELQLKEWNEDDALAKQFDEAVGAGSWKIWWMGDLSKSRKQIAPLLRDALKQTSKS